MPSLKQGLRNNQMLSSLQITHNRLQTAESIAELVYNKNLSVLDLTSNKLGDPEIVDVLCQLPKLAVLYLQGNPIRSNIPNYRKVGRWPSAWADKTTFPSPYQLDWWLSGRSNALSQTMINKIPSLRYLDDRPVFDKERRLAEAW